MNISYSNNGNGKLFLEKFGQIVFEDSDLCIHDDVEIQLDGKTLGKAKVIAIEDFAFNQIRDSFAFIHSGEPAVKLCKKIAAAFKIENGFDIKPYSKLKHVVFEWVNREIELHETLMKSWWESIKLENY